MRYIKKTTLLFVLGISITACFSQNGYSDNIIWSEDFGNGFPEGWTIVDSSGQNMPWFWTTDTICSPVSSAFINSETAENGFMIIPGDGYNSVPQFDSLGVFSGFDTVNTFIQTSAFDFTGEPMIMLEMHQQYMYNEEMQLVVLVSTDFHPDSTGSATWKEYSCTGFPKYHSGVFDQKIEILLDSATGNHSNVSFRFYAYGSNSYYWCIDDLKFKRPFANNLRIVKAANYFLRTDEGLNKRQFSDEEFRHAGNFTKLPLDQAHNYTYKGFKAIIENIGTELQTNVYLQVTILQKRQPGMIFDTVQYFTSEPVSMYPYQVDTIFIESEYKPENYECFIYRIEQSVKMDSIDNSIKDNFYYNEFYITDSTYSRVTENLTGSVATKDWSIGGTDGDGIGIVFTIIDYVEVVNLNWYFTRNNIKHISFIEAGGYTAIARIFKYDTALNDWEIPPIISAPLRILQPKDTASWLSDEFYRDGYSEYLGEGDYLLFLETATSDDDNNGVGFYIGEDHTFDQPEGTAFLWNGTWNEINANPAFELEINGYSYNSCYYSTENLKRAPYNFLHQNFPNPCSDITKIRYVLPESSKTNFEIADIAGKKIKQITKDFESKGAYLLEIDVSSFLPGIYYYTLTTSHFSQTRKLIVIR